MHDIEEPDDVLDLFGEELTFLGEDEYIAIYGQRNLIQYLFTELLGSGCDFGYANFDMLDESLEDAPYMLFLRGNCVISVEPALSNEGLVIRHDAKICYIDMDTVKQNIVNYCIHSDKQVHLFGYSDECDCDCENCEMCDDDISEDEETGFTTFSKHESVGNGYSSISFSSTDADLVKEFARLYK